MPTVTASELLHFNGINGATGDYLLPPLSPAEIVQIARGEGIDPQAVVLIGETKSFSRPSRNLIFHEIVPFASSRRARTL